MEKSLDDKMKEEGFERVGVVSRRSDGALIIPKNIVPTKDSYELSIEKMYAKIMIIPEDTQGRIFIGGLYVIYGRKESGWKKDE
ncbi:MAG: hypothetical protein Q8P57_00630 [Candidatus Pacearchaeota archaeon]|nr:hypothetical protein [Candidatus Pacearchaeota archaeon]